MRTIIYILIISAMSVVAAGCVNNANFSQENSDYQKVQMVLTTSGTEFGINTMTARKLAKLVEKESGGNVIIEVYPNERLAGGNTTKGVKMIADGSVDMAVYTSGSLAALDNRMPVATLPWTFTNYQEARKIIDSTGGKFYEKLLSNQGLIYLGAIHNGFRQISNNRNPVRSPEDLEGMKIRILGNEGYRLFFRAFDAEPIAMSRSEMSAAFRQGTIDGHDMGVFQSKTDKTTEIEKFLTIWNYAYETYIFMINSKTFERLEPKTQELLLQKSKEACEWGRDWLEEHERELVKEFDENGVEIIELSPEDIKPFKQKVRPLIDQLKVQYGEEACHAFGIN